MRAERMVRESTLAQKTWFITGISSGFGRLMTEKLLERGDRVAGTARKLAQLDDLKAQYGEQLWVAYLDLTGSGNEAAAHLIENGRMTIMFCAFDGAPLVLRLYGQGRVVRPRDAEWPGLLANFTPLPGQRQIVVLRIENVQTSCGFAVPCFEYAGERRLLLDWSEKKGHDGLEAYWREKNQTSIDGLPTGLVAR